MNAKARKILTAIFSDPVRSDLGWDEIEALFRALGADIRQGRGSRIRVALAGQTAVFHRPHPRPTLLKAAVKDLRAFLTSAGVIP